VKDLDPSDRSLLYTLLQAQNARTPEKPEFLSALGTLARELVDGAAAAYVSAIKNTHASQLGASVVMALATLGKADARYQAEVDALIAHFTSSPETSVGKAAVQYTKRKGKA